jgi:exopolyphosphatase/guanosine-5'-triphosphate,3'-diphosphate pyrophosphatase
MVEAVTAHVAPFAAEHGGGLDDMHLLGTSGTVTTLAGVHLNLPRYDRRRVDGIWINDAEITTTIAKLLAMSYQQRADNNCISLDRADLVLAGCAILDAIRKAFPLPRLRVADRGLREGMLVEMMREDGALRTA